MGRAPLLRSPGKGLLQALLLQSVVPRGLRVRPLSLPLSSRIVLPLVSESFPLCLEDNPSVCITARPDSVRPHANLIASAETSFPNKVTTYLFGGHAATPNGIQGAVDKSTSHRPPPRRTTKAVAPDNETSSWSDHLPPALFIQHVKVELISPDWSCP